MLLSVCMCVCVCTPVTNMDTPPVHVDKCDYISAAAVAGVMEISYLTHDPFYCVFERSVFPVLRVSIAGFSFMHVALT